MEIVASGVPADEEPLLREAFDSARSGPHSGRDRFRPEHPAARGRFASVRARAARQLPAGDQLRLDAHEDPAAGDHPGARTGA